MDKEEEKPKSPYHTAAVRRTFVTAAVVMIVTLPFFTDRAPISVSLFVMLTVLIGLFAGLTSPKQQWVVFTDTIISLFGLIYFEYQAVYAYLNYTAWDLFFWTNEILAVLFFFALYFATRTLRDKILGRK